MRHCIIRTLVVLFITLISVVIASGQEESDGNDGRTSAKRFSFFLGGSVGNFGITADEFQRVYSNRSISRIYFAGIGNRQLYLVGKYRSFFARGTSRVENIAVTGKADWDQKFYLAGLRLYPAGSPVYADLLYVMTTADETITTQQPVVSELTVSRRVKNQGGGVAVGLALDFLAPLIITAEVEYTSMIAREKDQVGHENPNIGGVCVSAGIFLLY